MKKCELKKNFNRKLKNIIIFSKMGAFIYKTIRFVQTTNYIFFGALHVAPAIH